MSGRKTELRRTVQHILAEQIQLALDVGEFTDLSDEETEWGFSEEALRAEIIRQQQIMRRKSYRS